ncbi:MULTISPECIES: hypothetical protein [unclassified Carboxylicivirga]|uniref:hypothetical protein n=1 Tax=Carboxylicivirga TaxID=1628153 RepID=UPI003D32EFF8
MKRLIPFLMGILLLTSCASKRNYNKAQKFDEAGLYADAAALYYKSLKANTNNIDAKLGLQRTGQLVLEDKLETFQAQYNNGTIKSAVYAYKEAEKYHHQLSALGVKLMMPDEQKAYYNDVKDRYLDQLYQKASKALTLEEFVPAEATFRELLALDPNFKDAQSQWIIAKYEPIYRRALQNMETRLYRSAYTDLNTINKATKGYQNSVALQQKCLEEATVSIAVLPFTYTYRNDRHYTAPMKERVVNELSQLSSPFYTIISDEAIRSIPGWTQSKDPATTIKYAKQQAQYFEAKTILSARINSYHKQKGPQKKVEKRAYLKQTVEQINPDTKLKEQKIIYTKVRYYEYTRENKVSLSLSFDLDRVDKDEKAIADTYTGEQHDRVHFARFEGSHKQLVPGTWQHIDKDSEADQIYDSENATGKLHALFTARHEITSIDKLESQLLNTCAQHVSKSVSSYQPEN